VVWTPVFENFSIKISPLLLKGQKSSILADFLQFIFGNKKEALNRTSFSFVSSD
jgi:hypothetical protein